MIVVGFGGRFIARTAVAELVTLQDARLLEQADRAIDGRDRDVGIDRRGARMERFDVGMVLAVAQDPRNSLALLGDPETLVGAELLNVDRAMHGAELGCG